MDCSEDYCHRCEKTKSNLTICEGCGRKVCAECCVEITPHNMVDFPFCKTCEFLNENY